MKALKRIILKFIFSQHEVDIIHDALNDKSCACKIALNESCQDAVYDIYKIKNKLPKESPYVFD